MTQYNLKVETFEASGYTEITPLLYLIKHNAQNELNKKILI